MSLSKHRLGAALLALLLISSGAVVAYTTVFTAGSGTSYETDSGLVVSTSVDHGLDGSNPFLDNETVYIDGVSMSASGPANVTVDVFRGTTTNLSGIDATTNTITVNPDDKSAVDIAGSVTALSFEDAAIDGTAQLTYSASGSGTITVSGLASSTEYAAVTTSGNVLTSGTTTAGGEATITVGAATDEDVVLLEPDAPVPDSANATPADGAQQTNRTVTFSVPVNDTDFADSTGDEVQATFYLNGQEFATQNITSNGSVSASTSVTSGGENTWHVEFVDKYGKTAETDADTGTAGNQAFTFSAPAELTFYKETSPDEVIDNVPVEVVAYYSGDVQRRTVTNGTLNLSDFPIDEPIIIRTNASGYYSRTVIIESVYDQSSVFLLNDSTPAYLTEFELQDVTGDFPESDTVLFVERDIKQNNSTEWRVIVGDQFGVSGVTTRLEQDERYRIRIKNLETGQVMVIGAYTAAESRTATVSTGGSTITIPTGEKEYGYAIGLNETRQDIVFSYSDDAEETQEVKLTIHERFNDSNVLVDNVTFTSNVIDYQYSLTGDERNTTWMAEIYVDRGNGFMHFRSPVSGGQQSLLPQGLDQVWSAGIGVFIVLISSLAFSQLNNGVGAIATALTGGMMWWFGLLDTVAIGPTVVVAITLAVIYHYYSANPGGGVQ